MNGYTHHELLPLGEDPTPYRLLTTDYVSTSQFEDREILKVASEGLTLLADQAIRDSAHLLRPGHLAQLRRILDDPEASDNDRFVALDMLKNANIAAGWVLPMCQDTGTAIVMGKKGHQVWTEGDDEAALSAGIAKAYQETNLRYSQLAPLSMFEEQNTRTNLPAQIEIFAEQGAAYKFMFMAKGGGSANKSFLFQETRALLTPERLRSFIDDKLRMIGTAACPPYHLALVIGGTSAEHTLKLAKLASTRYLDSLPTQGNEYGQAFRDLEMEAEVLKLSQEIGIGAQFGGKYFCHDVRVVRMPRHGASCPVGLGRLLLSRPPNPRQNHGRGPLPRSLGDRAGQVPARNQRRPARRRGRRYRPQSADGRNPRHSQPASGQHPALAHRPHDRRPRYCPRQAQGAARRWRGSAPVLQGSVRVLRWSGQDARRLCVGIVRADDGRAHGRVRRSVPSVWWQQGHAGQGQPLAPSHPSLPKARWLLPRLHRRAGGAAGPRLHPQGRGLGIPGVGHGGYLANRG